MYNFILCFPKAGLVRLNRILRKEDEKRILFYNHRTDLDKIQKDIVKNQIQNPIIILRFLHKTNDKILNKELKFHTVLRNPVESAISLWVHHHNTKGACGHENARKMPPSEFLTTSFHNYFIRILLEMTNDIIISNSDIDKSIDVLNKFDTVKNFYQYGNYLDTLSSKLNIKIDMDEMFFTLGRTTRVHYKELKKISQTIKFDCLLYEKFFNVSVLDEYMENRI